MKPRHLLVVVLFALTSLLGIAVSNASASHIEILEWERGFRNVQTLEFSTSGFSFGAVVCTVTFEGTFARHTFEKIRGTQIGSVTRSIINSCRNGTTTILNPPEGVVGGWPTLYGSFEGTLPRIEGITITILKPELDFEQAGFHCLASNTTFTDVLRFGAGTEPLRVSTGSASSASVTLRSGGGFGCPASTGTYIGAGGAMTYLGTIRAIGIRLI